MIFRWLRRTRPQGDDGMALLTVLGSMVVLTAFAMGSLAIVLQAQPSARKSQDTVAALAAAQAGIDDYIARLNVNPTYYSVNGTGVDTGNAAFTTGASIPGSGSGATFKYSLLTTPAETAKTGFVRLRSTGTSRGVNKSLTARLTQDGFLRFIYFTDVEVTDPALYYTHAYAYIGGSIGYYNSSGQVVYYMADPNRVATDCAKYYYSGRSSASYTSSGSSPYYEYNTATGVTTKKTNSQTLSGYCSEIQFTGGDTIQGPLHSNDALQINGSTNFVDKQTESSWPACNPNPGPARANCWWGSGTPSGYKPYYAGVKAFPTTNAQLKAYAASNGCVYTGQTKITFVGTQMKVLSPQTTSANPGCLDVANRKNEQTLPLKSVIYVNDTTSGCSSTDVGYPAANEDTTGYTTDYNCQYGSAFVSGTVSGQVTVGANRDVVVTGDLKYQNGTAGSDVLGLIPNNYVWVYNPVDRNGNSLQPAASAVHEIDAAILSLNHSFLVQNYDQGSSRSPSTAVADKLTVIGAIAQKFRGPVGTSGGSGGMTGYLKNYVYDARLRYLPPPYFLAPENSPWSVNKLSDG